MPMRTKRAKSQLSRSIRRRALSLILASLSPTPSFPAIKIREHSPSIRAAVSYLRSISTHNEILTYKIKPDGALDPGEMVAGGATVDPFALVIDPSGQFLYAATLDGVDAFAVQPAGNLVSAGHIDALGIEFDRDG